MEFQIISEGIVHRCPMSGPDSVAGTSRCVVTRSGELVSWVMDDVEGVRNLVGTGLVQLVGGTLTAVVAMGFLVSIDPVMTALALVPLALFGIVSTKAFKTLRPAFRERGKIRAEVKGRLTESLGGIREEPPDFRAKSLSAHTPEGSVPQRRAQRRARAPRHREAEPRCEACRAKRAFLAFQCQHPECAAIFPVTPEQMRDGEDIVCPLCGERADVLLSVPEDADALAAKGTE